MKKNRTENKILYFFKAIILIIILVALDQITKHQAVLYLKDRPNISIIPNVLELTYLENTGAAFSIMNSAVFFQTVMKFLTPVFFIIIMIIFYKASKNIKYRSLSIILLFILSGAIGNYIDRITNNYVIDFIYFSAINFPVFNVADIYVTLGFIIVAFIILFVYKDNDEPNKEK